LDREVVATEGNNPVGGNYDEEVELRRALNLSETKQNSSRGCSKEEVLTSVEVVVVL
jgi:hypothetical protein